MKKTTTILSAKSATAHSIIPKLYPMRSRGLAALAALSALVLAGGHASAASAQWNNTDANNNWFDAANWSPAGVPGSATTPVNVDMTGAGYVKIFGPTTALAGDLIVGNISTGTLAIAGSGGSDGTAPGFFGGSLTVTNTVTLGLTSAGNGTLNVFGGTAGSPAGDSTLTVGGSFNIGGFSNPGGGSGTLNVSTTGSATAIVHAEGGLVLDAISGQTATMNVVGANSIVFVSGSDFVVGNTRSGTNMVNINTGGDVISTEVDTVIGSGAGSTGTVNVGLGGTDTASLSTAFLSVGSDGTGNLYVSGTNAVVTVLAGSDVVVGAESSGAGTVTLTAGGTLDASGAGSTVYIDDDVASTGTINVGTELGGSGILKTATLYVGDIDHGTLASYGGDSMTTVATGNVFVGATGGTGLVTLTVSAVLDASTVGKTGTFTVGDDVGSMGTVDVGNHHDDAATLDADTLIVGNAGLGKLDLDGLSATVNVGTGNVNVANTDTSGASEISLTDGATMNANSTTPLSPGTFLIGRDAGSTGLVTVGDLSSAGNPLGPFTLPDEGAFLNVDSLVVGSYGSGTLIIAGFGESDVTPGPATVTVSTGNVSVGDEVTELTVSGTDTYSDETGPNTGTITVTEGGFLNAATTGLHGIVDIGTMGTGIVYVGLGGTDTATLDADTLYVGNAGTGTLTVSGTSALVTVGTGDVIMGVTTTTVTETRFGLGTINITQGGILDASAAGGNFVVGANGMSPETGFIGVPPTTANNFNVVNVGLGVGDTATLKTASADVGDTSNGAVNVNGSAALMTVNTGNLTVGDQVSGTGVMYIYNGGTVNATSLGGTGVTDVGRDGGEGGILLGVDGTGAFYTAAGTGGTLTADSMIVGDTGLGVLGIDNGTATVTDGMIIGDHSGGRGEAVIGGGGGATAMLTVTTGDLKIGNMSGADGLLVISTAGVVNVDDGDLKVGGISGGDGELEVNHGGLLNVTGNIYVDNGIVQEIDPSIINVTGNVHVTAGTSWYGGGFSVVNLGTPLGAPSPIPAAFTNFYNAGTLFVTDSLSTPPTIFTPSSTTYTINGNYVGQGGTMDFITLLNNGSPMTTGLLVINGGTSGDSYVHINKAIGSAGGQTVGLGIQIVSTPNGGNDGAFALDGRVSAGAYDYSLLQLDSGVDAGLYLQSHISPEVAGAISVPAAQQYLDLASLDTLVQREGELKASYMAETADLTVDPKSMRDPKAMAPPAEASSYETSEVWTRGIYRNDDVHTSVGRQDSGIGQVGGDYQFRKLAGDNDRLYVGGLADYGQSSGHTAYENVGIDGSDAGFGAYMTYLNGGFYADAVVKGNFSHETVKTQYGNFGASGSGVSASLESGYAFNVGSGVMIEPQAQLVYENESYNHPTDDLGRVYDFNDPEFLQARWGVRADKSFEYTPGLHITPYLRVNGLEQILGNDHISVANSTFNENITGLSVAVDGGFTIDVCKNVSLYINGNSAWNQKVDSYGTTGGVKVSW